MGTLDGRIAVITGAGRGIGREHALLFAREGASVVVNDLGGSDAGEGADTGPAQEVVDEITAAGGTAVANTENIATWDGAKGLVEQAVSEFGGLDVVVNNAGILRDSFIAGMAESEWDDVVAVQLATPGMGAILGAEVEEGEFGAFSPANISPLAAYLASEKCPITGKVFAAQGGAISELAGWHDVKTIETVGPWLFDDIAARLP